MIGIYKITNKINNKIYIGQSNNIEGRIRGHIKYLKLNKHKNKHLQSSVNKHKIINFTFEIVEECEREKLNERENYWIEFYNCTKSEFGYNILIGDFYNPSKLTNKEKKCIANIFKNDPYYSKKEIAKKYNVSASTIYSVLHELNIPKPKKICSEESRKKTSQTLKGRILPDEWKNNIGKAVSKNHGYSKFSEEQIDEVIKLLLDGLDNIQIQNMTNVSYTVINGIRNKKTWAEFTNGLEFPKLKAPNKGRGNSKITDEQVLEIAHLMIDGLTNKEIMEKFNISYTMVRGIRTKKTFEHLIKDLKIPNIKQKNQYK